MAWDVMILIRANPLQGPLEGVGHENRDFFGPDMATSEPVHLGLKKSSNGSSNGFSFIKIIKWRAM
jgi:hypothetical protein